MHLNKFNSVALKEVVKALDDIDFGSVEIIIQDGQITQISTRVIKKTNISARQNTKAKNGININLEY